MVNPAFQTIIGAFVGLLGGLSLNANARDKAEPEVAPEPEEPAPLPPAPLDLTPAMETVEEVAEDDDDDDLEPWEKYRNDLRYDANGDGVVDEDDFPDWRRAGQ